MRNFKIRICHPMAVHRYIQLPLLNMCPTILILLIVTQSCSSISSCEYVTKAQQLVPYKVQNFSVGEVRLLDGLFKESQDAEARYLLSLDLDRLLAPFRIESGIEPRAPRYPGWETKSLPGVALSFYLSGISRLYAMTGTSTYYDNINYILDDLRECQIKNNGYLLGSTDGNKIFKKLEEEGYFAGFDDWSKGHGEPYYVMEKLFSGLIDVYRICNIPLALTIAVDLADWLYEHMSCINDVELQEIMKHEYGGMNWVLSDLYVITGDARYLAMSKRWHDNHVVEPLTKGIDVLTGIHANSQFPKISGLAARYPYTADSSDLKGAQFFWESVVNHRSYVTGGNSSNEIFCPKDSMSHTLSCYTTENCNEYNMLKLTSLLYKINPRVEYADYMERTLFNHILSAQNTDDGRVCYYLALVPGAQKTYQTLYDDFKCCVCSAMDGYTRHSEYIYAHSDSRLYVNLFIASELDWYEKGISVRQETQFPYEDFTFLKFECKRKTEMCLMIRNPYWLSEPMTLKVNGELQIPISSEGYYSINRIWKTGDIVEINLPMDTRTECMPDDKNKIALFRGPVLLAGIFEDEIAAALIEENKAPAIVPKNTPTNQWLKTTDKPLFFQPSITTSDLIHLKPFFMVKTETYSVYWDKLPEKEWEQRIALAEQKKVFLKHLDSITVDKVIAGDELSEKNHALSGSSETGKGYDGILNNKEWRLAMPPEGFSYQMKVTDDVPVALYCKYIARRSDEPYDYRINIDTTNIYIGKRGRAANTPYEPVLDEIYKIPYNLTNGKKSVKVTFKVVERPVMPRLMEMRIIKR